MSDFGHRLEKLCKDRGITVSELSRKINVSRKTCYEWVGKSGRLPRDSNHLKKICDFFDVSCAWLLWGEDKHDLNLETLLSKTEIHCGSYEIIIKKINR